MSLNDLRSFEGQSWAALAKCVEKEYGPLKKCPTHNEPQSSNSLFLCNEDMSLYGKYPGAEPFVLSLCGYCGDRFKVSAMAKHLALRHPDGKVSESNDKNSQKGDVKSPNNILKKNKVKLKKDSSELINQTIPLKINQQPSKVLIQVDRKKVPYPTNRDALFISKHYLENHEDKLSLNLFKNDKDVAQKSEISKLKKPKDDFDYSSFKQNSPKSFLSGNSDSGESTFFPRSKDKSDSKKLKKNSDAIDEVDREKIKILESNISSESVVHLENGFIDSLSDDGNSDIKRQKIISKTKLYNPDRHCGVIGKENSKPCTHPLTCKSHTMSLRRAVRGRSKNFDQLLADHHAEKEASKMNLNDSSMDISMPPEIIKKLQLTPIKIPLVLNPHLTKVDPVVDVINCSSISNKTVNGVRLNNEINSDVMNNVNKMNHFQPSTISRHKIKKRRKKRKLNYVKKSQVKCFSQWHPWYRKIGGLLYTQNNLPTFTAINNIKKKAKPLFTDKKPNARYNMKIFRNFNSSNCVRRVVKSTEFDHRDWTVDFRLHNICLRNCSSTQVYSLEDVKDVYFKLIPESKLSSVLRIRNESLAITFPPSSLSYLANPLKSENQFLVQKKKDYPYIHKYIYSYNNSEDSSSDSDCEDLVIFDDITDIRYSMMEPVKANKELSYSNHITLAPLSGHPLRNHRFPSRPDERNFNLGVGTLNDGQVCLETINRLHFVTPSGPMAVALKQHPVISQGSYNLAKSLIEE